MNIPIILDYFGFRRTIEIDVSQYHKLPRYFDVRLVPSYNHATLVSYDPLEPTPMDTTVVCKTIRFFFRYDFTENETPIFYAEDY